MKERESEGTRFTVCKQVVQGKQAEQIVWVQNQSVVSQHNVIFNESLKVNGQPAMTHNSVHDILLQQSYS